MGKPICANPFACHDELHKCSCNVPLAVLQVMSRFCFAICLKLYCLTPTYLVYNQDCACLHVCLSLRKEGSPSLAPLPSQSKERRGSPGSQTGGGSGSDCIEWEGRSPGKGGAYSLLFTKDTTRYPFEQEGKDVMG